MNEETKSNKDFDLFEKVLTILSIIALGICIIFFYAATWGFEEVTSGRMILSGALLFFISSTMLRVYSKNKPPNQ